jgi:hypothetical protein
MNEAASSVEPEVAFILFLYVAASNQQTPICKA